jgi:hypothetical protein
MMLVKHYCLTVVFLLAVVVIELALVIAGLR